MLLRRWTAQALEFVLRGSHDCGCAINMFDFQWHSIFLFPLSIHLLISHHILYIVQRLWFNQIQWHTGRWLHRRETCRRNSYNVRVVGKLVTKVTLSSDVEAVGKLTTAYVLYSTGQPDFLCSFFWLTPSSWNRAKNARKSNGRVTMGGAEKSNLPFPCWILVEKSHTSYFVYTA